MAMIEGLESRQLLAAHVTSVLGDNRGELIVNFSEAVTGVRKSSVRLYSYGADGVANTSDDVRLGNVVKYDSERKRFVTRITGGVPANTLYRIRIQAREVRSAVDGSQLDGEFKADGSSGNGTSGGNYNARFRQDKTQTPRARISTTAGLIDVSLRKDTAPKNVANFLNYADTGRYDGIFVNRNIAGFIFQLGAADVTGDGKDLSDIKEVQKFAPVQNEFNLSNTRGTLAFAKQGGNPNSATSDFFFNLGNNAANLDNQNGGFTVFATVVNASSLGTMDSVAGKTTVALRNEFDGNPKGVLQDVSGLSSTGLTDVPVNGTSNLTTTTTEIASNGVGGGVSGTLVTAGLVPDRDLVIVRRVALLLKPAPVVG
jgi:cyclophilin family peptidyl-prolyl cis-trans isomerase